MNYTPLFAAILALTACGDTSPGKKLAECSAHFASAGVVALAIGEDPQGVLEAAASAEQVALQTLPENTVRGIQDREINKFKQAWGRDEESAAVAVLKQAMSCAKYTEEHPELFNSQKSQTHI